MEIRRAVGIILASLILALSVASASCTTATPPWSPTASPTFSPDAELVVYQRTRVSRYLDLPGWAPVPPGGGIEPPVTIAEFWVLADGTGLVSRVHSTKSLPDGQVIQESFYQAGGQLITKTAWDTYRPYYPPTDMGDSPTIRLDRGQGLESVISDPDWTEVTESTASGIRVFEFYRPPDQIRSIGLLTRNEFDADSGAFVQLTVSEAESGLLMEQTTIEAFEVSDSSAFGPEIWEPMLNR